MTKGGRVIRLREPMPELDGATAWMHGKRMKAELIGEKPTLFHFWSVSCEMCKETLPAINKIRDQFQQELNVIAVHFPLSENDLKMELIRSNAAKYRITQPIFIDGDSRLTNAFGNEHIPSYYLFDKSGRLRHFQAGRSGMPMLEKRIQRLL